MSGLNPQLTDLAAEIERQDDIHPVGYPATRDGIFMGICTAQVAELTEAMDAWRAERKIDGWAETRTELLQAAAVIMRTVRSIDQAGEPAPTSAPASAPAADAAT
jgi:hypothetical protein